MGFNPDNLTPEQAIENELLRDKIADYDKMYTHICEQLASVKRSLAAARAENAKLRELVKYAYECAIHSDHATCNDCERMNGCCILVDRMRELGIEVDE